MSLVVKNMTIGIETPLTTTPENGHRLDGMRRSTPIEASAKLAMINALKGAIPEDERSTREEA